MTNGLGIELERRNSTEDPIKVLFQISRALVGKQSLDEILQQIVIRTADLIESKICSLMLLDEKKENLVIRATQSLSGAYRGKPPIPIGQSISGRAVLMREVQQSEDVTNDPGYGFPEIARREGLKSLLSVPMMIEDEVVGVLNCYTDRKKVFSDDEIRLVQTIANHAAIAIEHMRMTVERQAAQAALETRKSVDQAKRVLMNRYQMTEESAHRMIQKMSMERNKPLREIADAIVVAAELPRK